MIDYDFLKLDKNMSMSEFIHQEEEVLKLMDESGNYTIEQINQVQCFMLAIVGSTLYAEETEQEYPEQFDIRNYLGDAGNNHGGSKQVDYLEDAKYIHDDLKRVHDALSEKPDGQFINDHVSVLTSANIVRSVKNAADDAGIKGIDQSVVTDVASETIMDVVETGINDRNGDLIGDDGLVDGEKVLNRYPDKMTLIKDKITQGVFKNRMNREGEPNREADYKPAGRGKVEQTITLFCGNNFDEKMRDEVEKPFSYFDLAVLESVTSLYNHAVYLGKDENGKVTISLDSIRRMLNHDKLSKIRKSGDVKKTQIYRSLSRLRSNYIQITEDSTVSHEGYLLDGEFRLVSTGGKLCFEVKEPSPLYEYAKSRGHYRTMDVPLEELKLNTSYTEEKIAIYRYLSGRIIEIFGTLKTDDVSKESKILKPKVGYSSVILLDKIIDAVYPQGLEKEVSNPENVRFKKRNIMNNVTEILDRMKEAGFFTDYEVIDDSGRVKYFITRSES